MLDTVATSVKSRFNSDCTTLMRLISFLQFGDDFEDSVRQLASVAQIDVDLYTAEASVKKLYRDSYNSTESVTTLQSISCTMVTLKHSVVYKHFYELVVFLLTLPVT